VSSSVKQVFNLKQKSMSLYSKNMVCVHCAAMFLDELDTLGLEYRDVGIGLIDINDDADLSTKYKLNKVLEKFGLTPVHDHKNTIITKIKNFIQEEINNPSDDRKFVLSTYLSEKLNYDYTYLANLFSATLGITITWYYITQKIERVKYLLIYEQRSVSEITYMLNYSSTAHLCSQFKKVTGLTPSEFKNIKNKRFFTIKRAEISTPLNIAK
jgi:AraC-like DNA-binding protein